MLSTGVLVALYTAPSDEPQIIIVRGREVLPLEPIEVEVISEPVDTNCQLIDALIHVESRGNAHAIGDGGKAVGCLQIHPIMVREVNKIIRKQKLGVKKYKLKDRFDCEKSIEMFEIWRDYHHENSTLEKVARNWNGGPRGHQKTSTLKYWDKVKKKLTKQ